MFAALLSGSALFACHKDPVARDVQTRYWLRQVAVVVRMYEAQERIPITVALSRRKAAETNLADRLFHLLRDSRESLGLQLDVLDKHLRKDAWGSFVNVDYTTNLVVAMATAQVTLVAGAPIVVWSSGFNRQDEHGGGDDILWPIQEVDSANAAPSNSGVN
jgi:hypothetical protein